MRWSASLLFHFLSFSPSKLPCYPYPSSPLGEVINNDITRSHNAPWNLHVRKLSVATTRYAPRGNETGAVRHLIHLESRRLDQCFCPSSDDRHGCHPWKLAHSRCVYTHIELRVRPAFHHNYDFFSFIHNCNWRVDLISTIVPPIGAICGVETSSLWILVESMSKSNCLL